jgi:aldehyde dehydrogenase (NAD+)
MGKPDAVTDDMKYGMFIDGAWTPGESGETMDVINPANQEAVAQVPKGGAADADRAVESARRAFESGVWSGKSVAERADILTKASLAIMANARKLAFLESLTSGATIRRMMMLDISSVSMSLMISATLLKELPQCEHAALSMPLTPMHSYWQREPIGVCAGITPWNFPMILGMYKIAPALAMGNSIVMKPASITPVTTLLLAQILHDAGVPAGVFNVVTGPGSEIGRRLCEHPDVGKIAFTGSTAVGRGIARSAAGTIKRVTLELGGKSPILVLDDADMDIAVNVCLLAFLMHSGQACESGTRLFVPRRMQDQLIAGMIAKIKKMVIGDPLSPKTDLGPIASQEQLDTIATYVDIGKKEGAELAYGGRRLTDGELGRGFFFEPTIFANCTNKMTHVREEIFGPVQCVIPYDEEDEAIAMANDSPYGLGGGVISTNAGRAQRIANRLRTGTVWINTWHILRPDAPFGGYKQSGMGRENCYHALLAYSEVKHVCQNLTSAAADMTFDALIGLNNR